MKTCNVCKRIYLTESDFFRRTSRFRVCSQGNLYFNCSCDGTVMVPQGKYGWFDPRKVLPPDSAKLWDSYQQLRDLSTLPSVCLETQAILDQPEAGLDAIARVVRADPHFAGRILAIADAARPKSSAPIRSLAEALAILGRRRLKELATLAAIIQLTFRTTAYTLEIHLRRSLLTGLIAELLSSRLSKGLSGASDLVFMAGALCDVGKVVSAVAFPDETDAVYRLTQSVGSPLNWIAAERKTKCVGHVPLGELACVVWGLPVGIMQSCAQHNVPIACPEALNAKSVPLSIAEHVAFANEISKVVLYEGQLCLPEVRSSCLVRHGFDQQGFERLVDESRSLFMPYVQALLRRLCNEVG